MSAIPAVVAAERVPGGEANRIVGVVDALKYFDANEGGFGFLRRGPPSRTAASTTSISASMPGCAIADRPPGLPRDSVALRKSTDTWQGSFIMQCDPDAYAANPLGVEAELRARLGEVFVRVECWGLAAMDAALTPDAGRLALDDDPGAPPPPGLVMLGSKKEMERLCAVGVPRRRRRAGLRALVRARAVHGRDRRRVRPGARGGSSSARSSAQGLPLHRAAPLLEAPDLAVAKGLLAQLATDAQTTLGDLRVLLSVLRPLAPGLRRLLRGRRHGRFYVYNGVNYVSGHQLEDAILGDDPSAFFPRLSRATNYDSSMRPNVWYTGTIDAPPELVV
ncbi:ubiquitin-protein transferase [Aureococcus anophagefferens]|nr:ubiquitin-protein transferase [Aureococcus anophagefferens]